MTLPEESDDIDESHEQDWQSVDMVAWILLLCITIECFIEGL